MSATYTTKALTPARDTECLIHTLERMRDGLLEAERKGFNVSTWDRVYESIDLACWTFGSEGARRAPAYALTEIARKAAKAHATALET